MSHFYSVEYKGEFVTVMESKQKAINFARALYKRSGGHSRVMMGGSGGMEVASFGGPTLSAIEIRDMCKPSYKCPACGHTISRARAACRNCGHGKKTRGLNLFTCDRCKDFHGDAEKVRNHERSCTGKG